MEPEDQKALAELSQSFKIFIKEWDDIKRNGFRFCAVNTTEIKEIRDDIVEVKQNVKDVDQNKAAKWVERVFIALMILILTTSVGLMFGGFKNGQAKASTGRYISDIKPDGATKGDKLVPKSLE